jgi:hypothetical protein
MLSTLSYCKQLWLFSAILLIKKPHFWGFFLEKEKKMFAKKKLFMALK